MPPEPSPVGQDRKGLWLPLLFLIFGLLITIAAVHQSTRFIDQEQQATFDAEAARLRNDFTLHTYRHIDVLRTYQAEFAAHPYFFDDAFKRMVQVLNVQERLPGIDAIGYVRRMAGQAAGSDEYVARFMYEPESPSLDGIMLPRDPKLLEALEYARDNDTLATTAPFLSSRDNGNQVFAVFLPLYAGGVPPALPEDRQRAFQGVVFVVIQPVRLMESLLQAQVMPKARVRLHFEGYAEDIKVDAAPMMLYDSEPGGSVDDIPYKRLPFALAGTRWSLELDPTTTEARSQRWLPWVIFFAGTLLSLLSALVVLMLQRARRQSQLRATEDRSLRREAETALLLRQRAIEASANAVVISSATRPGYPVEYVNPAFERMTGYSSAEIVGHSLRIMHGWDTEQEGLKKLQRILAERREGQVTLRNYHKDGQLYWTRVHIAPVRDESGEVTHFVAAKYDITQTRRYQETLEFQAWHDALTQLPNRHALRSRLTDAILAARPGDRPFWVAFLDLDNFKLMNDSLGHTLGDLALQTIAKRLQESLHGDDMVARRGGDEFVFILFDHEAPRNALATLHRIQSAVSRPLRLGSQRFYPACSIGIAIHPQDGDDPEVLIKHADMAMYYAKQQGRSNYQFFSSALQEQATERVKLEDDLREALANGEFELHYQPQLRLNDNSVSSMEALVRWHHPERGLIPPGQFIPLAEETGLIVPLGEWILRTACKQVAQWRDAGLPPMRVAVNLSARQFKDHELPTLIFCILRDLLLDPQYLELELTESLLAEDVEAANVILHKLKQLGVVLSLDDFGTGYSSLAQLKRLPLDILKIDRSFVSDISQKSSGDTIVRTVIKLAHNLGLSALAEGVETPEQQDFLREHGCDVIQGYLIAHPMPALEFEAWIRNRLAANTA